MSDNMYLCVLLSSLVIRANIYIFEEVGYRQGISKEWKCRAKAPQDFQASGMWNPGSEAAAIPES